MDQNIADLTKEEIVKFGNAVGSWYSGPTAIFLGSCYVRAGRNMDHQTLNHGQLVVTRAVDHLVPPSDIRSHLIIRDKDGPDACLSWIDR